MAKNNSALIGGIAAAWFLLCVAVGVYLVIERGKATTSRQDAERENLEKAKAIALPRLAKYGVEKLSDDAALTTLDGNLYLVGHGLKEGNRICTVMIHFDVAPFDGKEHWKILSIMVDEKTVYKAATNE